MKTLRNVVAALLFCTLAVNTSAQAKGHAAPVVTAQTAADANHRLQLIEQSLIDDGYALADVQEQPIYYLAAPAAPYSWGHLVYIYSRPVPGHFNLIQRVEVSAEVQTTATGYSFPKITIRDLLSQ
jgi:hypothetical protein